MSSAEALLQELARDPHKFDEAGKASALLKEYFAGLSLDTLLPVLRSRDEFAQRSAAFIVVELGARARPLLDDVIPLTLSADLHASYDALECVAVCADGDVSDRYFAIARALESPSEVIRRLAMRLMARAAEVQLRGAHDASSTPEAHREGIDLLLTENVSASDVATFLDDPTALRRRYGAIAAYRRRDPSLLGVAAGSSDEDLRSFVERMPKVRNP